MSWLTALFERPPCKERDPARRDERLAPLVDRLGQDGLLRADESNARLVEHVRSCVACTAELTARAGDVIYYADRYEIPVLTAREPEQRAGIITLAPAPQDAAPLAASLANHGLTVTARQGFIRVSPHVGTGADTLRLFGDALAAFSSSRVW